MIGTSDGKIIALDLEQQGGRIPTLHASCPGWRKETGLVAADLGPQPCPLAAATAAPMGEACFAVGEVEAWHGATQESRTNDTTSTSPKELCTVCRWSHGLTASDSARAS